MTAAGAGPGSIALCGPGKPARQFLGDQLGEAAVPGTDIDVTPDPFNRVSAIEAGRSVDPQEILNDCDGAAHDPRHPAAKIDAFSGVKACRRIAGGAIDAVGIVFGGTQDEIEFAAQAPEFGA